MRQTIESEYRQTLRVKLSHPNVGDIGDGSITFGYGCLAHFVLEDFGHEISLSEDQLVAGLLAVAENGTHLSLFNCECRGCTLYPEFVITSDIKVVEFQSFEVRYSDVSEWFFRQMSIDATLGKQLDWRTVPAPLVAEVSLPDHHFKVESFYVSTLEGQGEDRNLHQHFEFRFTAIQGCFSFGEIRQRALQLSNLLSILLAHPCPIVSVDVTADGMQSARLYYGIHKSLPSGEQPKDDRDRVTSHAFLTQKSDIDDCWNDVVNKFFRSNYRHVVWSRLAGMQNYEGFWEYRVLAYVTLLDSYVSQAFKKGPPTPPTKKLENFESKLGAIQPRLSETQLAYAIEAASEVFSVNNTFESKFRQLLSKLDSDVLKIINLSSADFKLIKGLRDGVAHGLQPSFIGSNITPVLVITNRIVLLLTHLFFLDVGLGRDVLLKGLARSVNKLRLESKIDQVHLDRVLKLGVFFQISPQTLLTIQQRPRKLYLPCIVRNLSGVISYSLSYSENILIAMEARNGDQFHELLGLPKEAVTHIGRAYFEDDTQIELVYGVVMIDLSLVNGTIRV